MVRELTRLFDGGHFFESPRWHDDRWWMSDFFGGAVISLTSSEDARVELKVPNGPSGLGWLPDGSLLAVSMADRTVLRRDTAGAVSTHADLAPHSEGIANDMIVTPSGHAYVGNMGYEWAEGHPHDATIVHVAPDGRASVGTREVSFPNGSVLLSDGVTLVVADTFAAQLVAWTIRPDGNLADRRVWADLGTPVEFNDDGEFITPPSATPDGCAVDAHDRIWVADAANGRAALVVEGGEVVDEIASPEGLPFFACALGGSDGSTLLLCASPDHLPVHRQAAQESVIFTVDL
ncbi:SMP-30/gluconolactonase/LRE family protein [Aeromicrobium panaciterrae]|uniref:SMP-30/gluconolactonase/LRE family protein n=1 Tax=Aeromicrobium panaciterrae TaxID=363861 RepID=UPI0031E090D8